MSVIDAAKEKRDMLLGQLLRNGRPIFSQEGHKEKVTEIWRGYNETLAAIMAEALAEKEAANEKLKPFNNPFLVYQHLSNEELQRARLLADFVAADFAKVENNTDANELMRGALATNDKALAFVAGRAAEAAHAGLGFHPYETGVFRGLAAEVEAVVFPADMLAERDKAQETVAEAEATYTRAEQHTSEYKRHQGDRLGVNAAHIPDPA